MNEVKSYFDRKAKDWNSYYAEVGDDLVKFDFIRRKKLVLSLLDFKGKKVLEVGCGPGVFTKELLEKKNRVWGIDISKEMVIQARRIFGKKARFEVGDIRNLDFKEGFFDAVIAVGVVPYVDEEAAFREIGRVLKSGGLFILTTNSPYSPNYLSRSLFNRIFRLFPRNDKLIFQKISTRAISEKRFNQLSLRHRFVINDVLYCSYKFFPFHKIMPRPFISISKRLDYRSRLGFLATERIYKLVKR